MSVKSIDEYPDLLTVAEAMEILRLGRRSVYQLIDDGTLAARKMAGKYRIPKRNLVQIIGAISPGMCYNKERENSDALQQKGV